MVNCINLIIEMSPRFVLGRENVPCVAEVVNRSLKADCTDFNYNIPRSKTEKGKSAITCAGPVTWNGLPTELRKAQSLDSFQQKLKTLLIPQQYTTSH